jgi:MoaA/NifB/PqqE/SkfB family radical SAM enzyme
MTLFLDHNKYYRLPWNLPDNAISWLEVTKACNMYCEGCYRENDPMGHKPLDEIKHDLKIFKKKIHGYVGPKFMELAQASHHLRHGRYLAYTKPGVQSHAKTMLLLASLDRGVRGVARNYLHSVAKNPFNLFKRLHLQSVTIIQPADILCDGSLSMCDGCPDITVWHGQLVWSCRLEEQMKFGCFVRAVPKEGVRNQPHEFLRNRVPDSQDGASG